MLQDIVLELGITTSTLYRWSESSPLFAAAFARARDTGIDVLVDSLVGLAETEQDVYRARLKSDNIKWLAERRARRRYGQQIDLNITERVDLGGTLIEARKRSALPACDLAALADAQAPEYAPYTLINATDTQSPADDEPINPFD